MSAVPWPRKSLTFGGTPPRVCYHPEIERSFGPQAIELYASTGQTLDDWQCDAVHLICAIDATGKWLVFECGCIVPRQNGKGAVLEARALAGLFLFRERLIMWSAHEYKTAVEGFRRVVSLIENTDDLRRQVKSISRGNVEKSVELLTGQRLIFVARSKGSGRGFTGDCNLIDEAYAFTEDQKSALLPTMSAVDNPQIVYASSPPLDGVSGEPLFALRDRALTGTDPQLGWLDWGLDLDPERPADIEAMKDPANWRKANPAHGIRITSKQIEREHRAMSPEAFGRERLGVWPKRATDAGLIDMRQWGRLGDPALSLSDPVSFAVDVSPLRDRAAIVACAPLAGGGHVVEVVDYRPGTEWITERLVSLRDKWNPIGIALDMRSPAGALLFEFEDAGLVKSPDREQMERNPHKYWAERGQLALPTAAEVSQACGQFYDAVIQGTLRHQGQGPLDVAVRGAVTRPVGDAYGWARRQATVDISPLCAATLARWVWLTREYLKDEDPLAGIW